MSDNYSSDSDREPELAHGGVCPVCGDEFTDGFDDLAEGESVEGVRLCVIETDGDGTGDGLFHLPQDQTTDLPTTESDRSGGGT